MLFSDAPRRLPTCQAITMEHVAAYKRFNSLFPIKQGKTPLADAMLGHHSAKRRKGAGRRPCAVRKNLRRAPGARC